MNLNPEESRLYSEAVILACRAHHGQFRKYTGEPYVLHPIEVAEILRRHDRGIKVICGGVLHDVVEDTEITSAVIQTMFGEEIANIVEGVTNVSEDKSLPRYVRFWRNVKHLAHASEQSQDVKCADIISNCRNFRLGNESFTAQYMAEKSIVIEHLYEADSCLIMEAKDAIEKNLFGIQTEFQSCVSKLWKNKTE
ncbi:putative bifunctional (p)ppGpp synthetase/guanosine-3' 5'-bis diphosphate 3'-pyrophosphohydrolase protein [Dickeya phage vB_DsoM_JA13]|uniref:Putative bifunctional (P)ppGpp synthetase/guanosine-3' 5'-bis diphosphate 3'-pyrophosphohydrolase protein n=1 Tax=Dickeya phage vB_DsoM_JA13 TaxID=2283030 RepID=A0A384ZW58_9CAUD|nr:putative bifunctional (p)ppGpp synthetase/guanosine-3' 5'-bis diphosphate 3'-pyrophosphohydrolase protein [Dickeya phage vB_DsoM_JA13]